MPGVKVNSKWLKPGSIFVIAIVFLLFVMIFSVAIFTNVANFSRFGSNQTRQEQAVNLVEADIDYAIWQINQNPDYLSGGAIEQKDFGPGTFEISVDHGSPGDNKKIKVLGYIPAWPSFYIKATAQVEITNASSTTEPVNLLYAIHSGDSNSELRISSSSQIVGDVHSNYTICTIDNCPATPTVTINGNVSAVDNIADGVNVAAPYTKTEGAPFLPLPSINHYDWVNEADAGTNMGTTNWDGGTRELGPAKITGTLTLSNKIGLTLNGPVHITGNLILNGGTGGNMAKIRLNEALGSQGTAIVVDGSMGTFSTGGTFKNVTIYPTSSNPKGFLFLVSTKTGTTSELMPAENVQGHAVYLSRGNAYIGVYSTTNLTGALIVGRVGTSGAITYDDDLAEFSSSGSGASGWQIVRGTYKFTKGN